MGLMLLALTSCDKSSIDFDSQSIDSDPNISLYTDYKLSLSTFQVDSFVTSTKKNLAVGYHADPALGAVFAAAYTELAIPEENTVEGNNVSLDSIVLMLYPNGHYYGDTTALFPLQVNQLVENIDNETASDYNFYNPKTFAFSNNLLADHAIRIKPASQQWVRFRLNNATGSDLLNKLKSNDAAIQSQEAFREYFKGLYIHTDSAQSKSIYYFNADSAPLVRLYYTQNDATPVSRSIDFKYVAEHQFNHVSYHHSGTSLANFTPFKTQILSSDLTGNKAYICSNMGKYIKINFPSLYSLKESHPYVKIVKADLDIIPQIDSYRYPYKLPTELYLYTTNADNTLQSILYDSYTSEIQTGNLVIDELYGTNTKYTYDVTSFVNELLDQDQFSTAALMLIPAEGITDTRNERLILEDSADFRSVELNLYVLGL